MKVHTIVIGSGIAGLNFALNAAQHGKVLIVTKKRTANSSTNRAQGGIAAVLDKTDNVKQHVKDTMVAGSHHNKKGAVEFMVKNSADAIMKLIEMGVPFATDERGELILTREGGHGKRRIAFVGDYTGQEIESALVNQVTNHPNITIWEYTFAVDLLVENGTCYGVQVIHNDKTENLYAANTVIATGGVGQLYQHTTNPVISTGDGMGMGLRAGVKTKDMEFVQFHPTALKVSGRTKFLLSEALRGEGAYLKDSKGKRFMVGKHKRAELAPRDVVAREVYSHDLQSGAFLDMSHLKANEIKLRFPRIYQKCKSYKLDLTKNLIPISPAAHYIGGGLITNQHGETSLKGLYAFGEVAWTGVHGANRLASNSLLEALVFSSQIMKKAKLRKLPSKLPRFPKPKYKKPTSAEWQRLNRMRQKLRHLMWENVGIIRTPKGLKHALQQIETLKLKLPRSKTLNVPEKENENMFLAAEAITKAALNRKKSLGNHFMN
jgi:L-aspartate oxidase